MQRLETFIPQSWFWRVLGSLSFTLLPVVSFFLVSAGGLLIPEGQTGSLTDYVAMLFDWDAAIVFFPFLSYAALSMLLLFIAPEKVVEYRIVRFGIYTGVILSLQYSLILSFITYLLPIISASVLVTLYVILRWLFLKSDESWWYTGLTVAVLTILITVIVVFSLQLETPVPALLLLIFFLLIGIFLTGPIVCLYLSIQATRYLWHHHGDRFESGGWLTRSSFSWLTVYSASWIWSVSKAMSAYAALPTESPDCYIATAASHGHPSFVKSTTVAAGNGKVLRITAQLQYFKFAELSLLTLSPKYHYCCRLMYDFFGKRFALYLTNPYLADIAYLLLKPAEYGLRLFVMMLPPDIRAKISRMYGVR